MRLRDRTIGALNLFGTADTLFDPDDARVVQALADIATIVILQERGISRAGVLTERLQGALNSRVVIEQAKGAIAVLQGIGVDEAFALLRHEPDPAIGGSSTWQEVLDGQTSRLDSDR